MNLKARIYLCAVVLGVGLVSAAPPPIAAHAASTASSAVFPPDAIVFGQSYSQWSATWWQWNFSIPVPSNPTFDTTGQHCGVGQVQPVFFLAGIATGQPVTRACAVPSSTPLFFPLINVECSNVEAAPFFGSTDAARLACAQSIIDGVSLGSLKTTLDGAAVSGLKDFRFSSPPFDFSMPAQHNILGLPGVTAGRSESDGYWLMLKPLSVGAHVLHFQAALVSGVGKGFSQNVTYNLTVLP